MARARSDSTAARSRPWPAELGPRLAEGEPAGSIGRQGFLNVQKPAVGLGIVLEIRANAEGPHRPGPAAGSAVQEQTPGLGQIAGIGQKTGVQLEVIGVGFGLGNDPRHPRAEQGQPVCGATQGSLQTCLGHQGG
jgi:hypothetical protein